MRKIEVEVYEFDELPKNIRETLIEKEIQQELENYCDYFLKDDMQEEATRLLHEHFDNHKKYRLNKYAKITPYYDLSYSQGSGAMIEFELEDIKTGEPITIKQYGYYTHERSFTINTYADINEEELKEEIVDINYNLSKYGYKQIEYTETTEEATEYLNNFEFYADGRFCDV